MTDGLERIEELAGAILRSLAPSERRKLLRQMARGVAVTQRERIGRQLAPDGTRFAARKPKQAATGGSYPLRFLYPKGATEPRAVAMTSWVRQGPLITGYDTEAGGIRSFFWDKVAKWLPAADLGGGTGKLRRRGAIRQKAMFRKLRNGRNLRSDATDTEAWIGFSGRAAEIARVHQEGLRDRPSRKARPVTYARRTLLGLTEGERSAMIDMLLAHVAGD